MKKELLYSLIGACVGATVGFAAAIIIQKVREKREDSNDSPLLMSDVDEPEEEIIVLTQEEAESQYHDILAKQGYTTQEEVEDDSDEDDDLKASIKRQKQIEAYKKEHAGRIDMMGFDEDGEAEWDTDFPEEDYEHVELLYFPEEDILCTEDGDILIPIEKYAGDLITRANRNGIKHRVMYIRNHPLEQDFKIHREIDVSYDDYFETDNIEY